MSKNKGPKIGYDKSEQKHDKKKNASYLYHTGRHKVTFNERLIKTIIYLVLRLVIKPSKWRNNQKKYEVIDRAYKRIMSSDMIYIPSSISFYLIMSFMPVLSIIVLVLAIPGLGEWLNDRNIGSKQISSIIGKFIPGSSRLFSNLTDALKGSNFDTGAITVTISSLFVSTWISAGGFSKLVYTQSYMYKHKYTGGYWMNKFKGMGMVFVFTVVLFGTLTGNVFVQKAIDGTNIPQIWNDFAMYSFLIFVLFIGMFLGFLALFKLSPRFKLRFREVMPGALVAGIPTGLFLAIFGPITSMWNYSSYGTVASIMYIGMASLFITNFIYVALATNVAFYQTFVRHDTINKWTFSKK